MGRRKQKMKTNLDRTMKEASPFFNHGVTARNIRKTDLGGVIFGATHNTFNECISLQLFGLPEGHYSYIKNISQGLVLFLFNYSDRKLHGIFEAAGHGQLNIDQYAWVADGDDTECTRYPAQVKISVRKLCHPLSEHQFQPIIAHNYYESKHFHFELDYDQTAKLVTLFTSSPVNPCVSTSLLPTTKRQECNVLVSSGMTSGVSYASALGRTSTTTTTTTTTTTVASSSQPAGKWSALFKSEVDTTHEMLLNQENDDKDDVLQAPDTWEESIWAAIYTDEAECDRTWASNLNPQANTASNKTDVMPWEKSQHIAPTTCEIEHGQTSNTSGQHFARPSSSRQHLDGNPDFNLPLSIETDERDINENHEKDNLSGPNRVVETSTDLQAVVAKLMQEFEVMKVSHLKQNVKINMLEQELDTSKQEFLQLRNRVRFLESGSRSNLNAKRREVVRRLLLS